MEAYCTGYKQFLDAGKTERECVDRAIAQAEAAGFRAYVRGMELKPGDQDLPGEPGQGHHAGGDGPERPGARGQHRGGPHRLPPAGPEAEPPVRERRAGLLQDPLLRRHPEVPVGDHSPGAPRRGGAEERQRWCGSRWATGRTTPCSPSTTCCPTWPPTRCKKPLGEAIPAESLNILVGSRPLRDDEGSDRVKLASAGAAQPEVRHRGGGLPLRRAVRRPRLPGRGHRLRPLPDRRLRP